MLQIDADLAVSREFGEELGTPEGWGAVARQLSITPGVIVAAMEPNSSVMDEGKRVALEAVEGDWTRRGKLIT